MTSYDDSNIPTRGKNPRTSQKLGRTLKELETAFNDWEALGQVADNQVVAATVAANAAQTGANASEGGDKEFRQKTKKLLSQLREQLNELND